MAQFFTRPQDSQPQDSVQPSSDWRLDGLWFPASGYPGGAAPQANATVNTGSVGRVWQNAATTNAAVVLIPNSASLPLSEVTLIVGGAVTTTATGGEVGVSSATTTHRLGAHLPYTDNKVYWDFGGTGSGTTRLATAGTVTRNERDVWALTAGPRGMEIWQNGVLIASNAATPTRSASTAEWGLGPQGVFSGTRPASRWWMVAISSKQASTQLLRRLTSPEAAFAELVEPRRVYIPGATAGGSQSESGGASSTVTVTAAGAGSAAEAASGGASASVIVTAAGAGASAEQASGGESASVTASSVGAGSALETASGGASAAVSVSAVGDGESSDGASGGSVAAVSVSAVGAGIATETASGGASAAVLVTAAGVGLALEIAASGSSAGVLVSAVGSGTAGAIGADDLYPLAGLTQSLPLSGSQAFPLAGQQQTYPLG